MNHLEVAVARRFLVLLISLLLILSVGLEAARAADSKATFTVQ